MRMVVWLLLGVAQATSPAVEAPSRETAVLAAAARGVTLDLLTHDARESGAVACILLERDGVVQPPTEAFLQDLATLPFVRSGADCEHSRAGAFEAGSGAPAFLITVGPVEWIAPDEGHVQVVFRREGSHTHRRLYRVVRERMGWVSLGQIIEMAPA